MQVYWEIESSKETTSQGRGVNRAGKSQGINRVGEDALVTRQGQAILRADYGRRSSKTDI